MVTRDTTTGEGLRMRLHVRPEQLELGAALRAPKVQVNGVHGAARRLDDHHGRLRQHLRSVAAQLGDEGPIVRRRLQQRSLSVPWRGKTATPSEGRWR